MKGYGARSAALASAAIISVWCVPGHAQTTPAEPVAATEAETDQSAVDSGEVIVTAQRRSESLQKVPLSIVALNADQLAQQNITTVGDLQRAVPNFTTSRGTSVSNTRFNIRGIGAPGNTSLDQSVAIFLDGVYVARPSALYATLLDIDAIEVVRGPQGTLFGRNTTAGGILLRSAAPTATFQGSGYAEGGNYGRYKTELVVSGPVSDGVRVRTAFQAAGTDGFGRNLNNGRRFGFSDSLAGRVSLEADLTSRLTWLGKADFSRITGDGQTAPEAIGSTIGAAQIAAFAARLGGTQFLPDFTDPTDFKVRQITTGDLHDRQYGGSSRFTLDLGNDYQLRLISGYRDYRNRQFDGEVFFVSLPLSSRTTGLNSESSSHELQIVSPKTLLGDRLSFTAGLYYFQEDLDITEGLSITPNFCNAFTTGGTRAACLAGQQANVTSLSYAQSGDSVAAFGQADFDLTPQLTVQLGARYTRDKKNGSFVQTIASPVAAALRAPESTALSFRDDRPTYRASLTWAPSETVSVFGSFSTGYKSGGFNSGGGTTALGVSRRTFGSEKAKNYELGFRSQFADRRVTLNATLYRIDLADYQDRSFDGSSFVISNAGSLRHQGVEIETRLRVTNGFRLAGSLAYLDSEFRDFPNASAYPGCSAASPAIVGCGPVGGVRTVQDLTGGRAHNAPKWQGSLNATYDTSFANDWHLTATAGVSYVGEQFTGSVTDNNPQVLEDPYALLNARLLIETPGGRWGFSVFGENLTNQGYCPYITYQTSDSLVGVRNPATGGTLARCFPGAPRTYGASVRVRF